MAERALVNILLIEDEPLDAKIIIRSLTEFDNSISIKHIRSLAEAENMDWSINQNQFSCIVLDYNFPTGVSSNFLHFQKSIFKNKCPIFIVTGNESLILKNNVEKYENVYFFNKSEETYKVLPSFILSTLDEFQFNN